MSANGSVPKCIQIYSQLPSPLTADVDPHAVKMHLPVAPMKSIYGVKKCWTEQITEAPLSAHKWTYHCSVLFIWAAPTMCDDLHKLTSIRTPKVWNLNAVTCCKVITDRKFQTCWNSTEISMGAYKKKPEAHFSIFHDTIAASCEITLPVKAIVMNQSLCWHVCG